MSNGYIIPIVGDMHVNSTVALCPPSFMLDDGGTYSASPVQTWIWERWEKFWEEVVKVKEKYKLRCVAMLNGELADNNVHHTTQLISRNPADQIALAESVLLPIRKISDNIIVIRGTEAHTGPSANMDEIMARKLRAVPSINSVKTGEHRASWWEFYGEFSGVTINISHHPGTSHRRPYTKGNDAMRLAFIQSYKYMERGLFPPDLVIRGHNHIPVDSFDNHPSRAIIGPSWQLNTSYGYRIGGGWLPVGGMYVLCRDGKYKVIKRYFDWPVEDPWTEE